MFYFLQKKTMERHVHLLMNVWFPTPFVLQEPVVVLPPATSREPAVSTVSEFVITKLCENDFECEMDIIHRKVLRASIGLDKQNF